jgi:hypothetical protein
MSTAREIEDAIRAPPHIHVARGDHEAKFWLQPIALAVNFGFAEPELRDLQRLVEEHCDKLIEA